MTTATFVSTDVEFERQGRQISVLRLPHSSNTSGYGSIPIPIGVIAHGVGPTVLLTGATHGDEYEGPLALAEMIRDLPIEDVRGRLIIIPTLNAPAALAGLRNSPIDGKNLNRCFPGQAAGSATEQIAHYVTEFLLPLCDAWLDLHSGGASLDFVHCVNLYRIDDTGLMARTCALASAFGAPLAVVMEDRGAEGNSLAAARRRGIPALTTEVGAGATVSIAGLRLCRQGIRASLAELGALRPTVDTDAPVRPTRFVQIADQSFYVYAPVAGIFEPLQDLGAEVSAGQPAGRLHSLVEPTATPLTLSFQQSGVLCGKRVPAKVYPGDCVAVVARDMEL